MHMHRCIHFHTHTHLTLSLALSIEVWHSHNQSAFIHPEDMTGHLASLFFPCLSPTHCSITGTAIVNTCNVPVSPQRYRSGRWGERGDGESIALVVIKWEGSQTSENTTCGAVAITEDTDLQTSVIFLTQKRYWIASKPDTRSCSTTLSTICVYVLLHHTHIEAGKPVHAYKFLCSCTAPVPTQWSYWNETFFTSWWLRTVLSLISFCWGITRE